jgi:hypothetical protein
MRTPELRDLLRDVAFGMVMLKLDLRETGFEGAY